MQLCGLEPPWQVWKIELGIAAILPFGLASWALLQSNTYTCTWKKLKGKNGQHFVLFPRQIAYKNLSQKNGQHSVLLIYTKLPTDLCGVFSPSSGHLSTEYGAAPLAISPLPWIPSGSTGYGAFRGGGNLHWFSSRYGRSAPKRQLAFGLLTSNTFV